MFFHAKIDRGQGIIYILFLFKDNRFGPTGACTDALTDARTYKYETTVVQSTAGILFRRDGTIATSRGNKELSKG